MEVVLEEEGGGGTKRHYAKCIENFTQERKCTLLSTHLCAISQNNHQE